jgi:hypothetical protein
MMNEISIEGGCMCGQVRYRATAWPIYRTLCHCSDCRRAVGAQSVAFVTFPGDRFEFTRGAPAEYASSPPVIRTFCPRCGTSLTYVHRDRGGEVDVCTASLDDPEAFPPTQEFFQEQKLSWA